MPIFPNIKPIGAKPFFLLAGYRLLWVTGLLAASLLGIPLLVSFFIRQTNPSPAQLLWGLALSLGSIFLLFSAWIGIVLRHQIDALQESRARNRIIVDNMADAVIHLDAQANIVAINRAGEQLFGSSQTALRGQPFVQLLAPVHQPDYAAYLQQVITKDIEPSRNGQLIEGIRQEGTRFPLVMSLSKTRIGHYPVFTILIHDMTDHQRALASMAMMRDHAEAVNQAKNRFLSNMSHELRTPLNGIIGGLELLNQTNLAPEQAQYISIAQQSSTQLLNIISTILDYSLIEMGQIEVQALEFNPKSIFFDSVQYFQLEAQQKHLKLSSTIDPIIPEWVKGDPFRLRQILTALLENALKFTRQGEIQASLSLLESIKSPPQSERVYLYFKISDTGIGIPNTAKQRILLPFTQQDDSTTRDFGGIGLGLTIARRLTQLLEGDLGFESTVGVGSQFWFYIPVQPVTLQ